MDFVIQWSYLPAGVPGGLGCCLGSRHSVGGVKRASRDMRSAAGAQCSFETGFNDGTRALVAGGPGFSGMVLTSTLMVGPVEHQVLVRNRSRVKR